MEYTTSHIIQVSSIIAISLILLAACWTDSRSRRIPNKLILIGFVVGLALQFLLPYGQGLFMPIAGSIGGLQALYGFAVGFFLLIPLYVMRAMGAGDVKLMAVVGIFLGPTAVFGAVLMTFVAGGVLAIFAALYTGVLRKTLENSHILLVQVWINAMCRQRGKIGTLDNSTMKLPYAFAISSGTMIQIIMMYNGNSIIV